MFSVDDDWTKNIVKDDFRISKAKEIKKSLLEGTPCLDKDPIYILHAYYEAYKESKAEKRPNYAATIHSLAFNKFKKTKEK